DSSAAPGRLRQVVAAGTWRRSSLATTRRSVSHRTRQTVDHTTCTEWYARSTCAEGSVTPWRGEGIGAPVPTIHSVTPSRPASSITSMRPVIVLTVLVAAIVVYGAHRNRQAQRAREIRAAAVRDSTRRADSLQHEAIRAAMGQQAAAQLAAQQARANLAATQAATRARA